MRLFQRIRGGYLAMLAAGVAIGFTAVGTAAAVSSPQAAGTVHHYTIAASAFAPDSLRGATNDYFNRWDFTTLSNLEPSRCFNAGLALPNGARLRSVTFYFTNGTTAQISMELNRQFLANHSDSVLVSVFPPLSGTPTYMSKTKSVKASQAIVNTAKYAYSIGVCPISNSTFSGVTVNYTS